MFCDIPLKGSCIVSNLDLMLGVGETPIPLLCNRSVSFEIYGYLPISSIGRSKRRSLTVTFMEGVKSIYILER